MNIGIDIIEINRIKKIVNRNQFFLANIFSEKELGQISGKPCIYSSIAARFCAKEAFFKCIGTGIRSLNDFKSVEILNNKNGQPKIYLNEFFSKKYENFEFSVSLSHCKNYACSVVNSMKK